MTPYVAPIAEMRFAMAEIAGLAEVAGLPGLEEATADLVQAVLEEAGKFAGEILAPLNTVGDRQGARIVDGKVATPAGWRDAYRAFTEAGWNGLVFDPEWGGQGLPWLVNAAAQEMWHAANMAFGVCPMLTQGAIEAVLFHGSEDQKRLYLPKLISGVWTGTMCLTEPQAGSDLAMVRTRAVPDGERYRITGSKIYISYGDHDLAANIVHLVLARTPDAPEGVKGLSLFVVPKFLPEPDGEPGHANDLRCVSLEHKLGIHGSPTATMAFGDAGGAVGWLVGQENRGLEYMFTMMNMARLSVGLEGVAIAERAYQAAAAYAHERVQGRVVGGQSAGRAAIVGHMDVRRMLLDMKARTEAMRAVAYGCAASLDVAHRHPDPAERARALMRVELLTPIVKGWCTEWGVTVASTGLQVFGGMGYVEETGAAQFLRDARIATIYEGTTGIQANDLVGRKVIRDGGAGIGDLIAVMRDSLGVLPVDGPGPLPAIRASVERAVGSLESAVAWLIEADRLDRRLPLAAAVPFLELAGTVLGGHEMARAAARAEAMFGVADADSFFLQGKLAAALHYALSILPRADALLLAVTEGSQAVLECPETAFDIR